MKLAGKVNKIERITATRTRNELAEEKRVYHLTVRLPDPTLASQYSYGYGNMNFIAHGKQMDDFVDLGADVEIYVIGAGKSFEIPDQTFHDMQSEIYRLEGELTHARQTLATVREQSEKHNGRATESTARLNEAMREAIRLTAENEVLRSVRGVEPQSLAQLGFAPASATEAQRAETGTGSVHDGAVPQADAQGEQP